MALFNKDDKTPSATGFSIDSEAAIEGAPSLLTNVNASDGANGGLFSDVVNFATKALPLTAISVVDSFANTPRVVYNLFGGKADYITPADWGVSEETQQYYKEHQQGIETAGLVVGAFLPASLALKGFNGAMKAAGVSAAMYQAGEVSDVASSFTGLLPGVAKKNLVNEMNVNILGG